MRAPSGLRRQDAALVITVAVAVLGASSAALAGADLWLPAGIAGVTLGALIGFGLAQLAGERAPVAPAANDALTGLPDARALHAELRRELAGEGFGVALHVCVLHGMKEYNDAYGEACGDAMIAWLAHKLQAAVAERATVYRLRGASFAVLGGLGEPEDAVPNAAARALLEVGEGFMIRGEIGRAALPEEAQTPEAGLELATRRALAERREPPGEEELRPPQDPLEVMPLERPRYPVAELAARIGQCMGLAPGELHDLEAAAHLRDVGNMAVPSAVLARDGQLASHEWEFVRLHPVVGERLLASNFGMEAVGLLVRSSHERWDGRGYPDGLSGAEVPLGARILFVCAAFQDMTGERPHRPARSAAEALAELERGAGTQFDPEVVAAFQAELGADGEGAAAPSPRRVRRFLNVLVADDDAAARFLLARAIDAAGHSCITAEDGVTAWRTIRRLRPDVVICDSRLPRISAERLCRRLRQEEDPDGRTYFVTLVALQEGERVQRDTETGADDFLAKPFDREDLETMLAVAVNEVSLRRDTE